MASKTQTDRTPLKYAAGPLHTLHVAQDAGGIAATVRYEDEKNLEPGDVIDVVDAESSEVVGTATIVRVTETQVYRALDAIRRHGAIYGTRMVGQLLQTLNQYYGDEISPETDVKVIFVEPDIQSQSEGVDDGE